MSTSRIDSRSAGWRNEKAILSLIREQGEISQAQICRSTGLGSSTVSYIVGRLREKGLIQERRGQSTRRGAKPVLLSVHPAGLYIVGMQINPSRLLIGLYDFQCMLIDKLSAVLDSERSVEKVADLLQINLLGLLGKHKVPEDKLIGIGVTVSGSLTPEGVVELSSPMGWKGVALRQTVQSRFRCPVETYTTRVRVLAEIGVEPGLSRKNVLYLNVGDGVGATVLVNGQLARGSHGMYGEIGHIVMEADGPLCGCGLHGCLEALISGPALSRQIREAIAQGVSTSLRDLVRPEDSPEEVVAKWGQAVVDEDAYALSLRDEVAGYLSRGACIAMNCYDPELVLLGGYVAGCCYEFLAKRICDDMADNVYDASARKIEILPAKAGEESLTKGCALARLQNWLVEDEFLGKR